MTSDEEPPSTLENFRVMADLGLGQCTNQMLILAFNRTLQAFHSTTYDTRPMQ